MLIQISKKFPRLRIDLICLKRDLDFTFNNIFDTFTAARILGREAVGLGSLLESEFSMTVNKRSNAPTVVKSFSISPSSLIAQIDTHFQISVARSISSRTDEKKSVTPGARGFQTFIPVNNHNGE
jgi:hypothetical protein